MFLLHQMRRIWIAEAVATCGLLFVILRSPEGKASTTPYEELDLGNAKWNDEELLDFMMAYPILINRPIVVTPLGTKLCRPSEAVLDILVNPQMSAFSKEDGEVVINEKGLRV